MHAVNREHKKFNIIGNIILFITIFFGSLIKRKVV